MRKLAFIITLAASAPIVAATAGCNSTWWQNFLDDPVQQAHTFEQGVQIALSDAQVAWTFVQPYLPAANAAQINQQFQNAIFAVNHAMQVLNDAITAAVAAKQPSPDFSALIAAVTDAVGQVLAIVDQYVNGPAPATDGGAPVAMASSKAPPPPALAEAHAILANLKKQYAAKH